MPSFNKVVLIGRLTRDPEMRYTTSGLAVTTFSIAVDRRSKGQDGEKKADFFRCTAWRQSAEFVNSYASKGRLVAVEGRIELNEYVGQDGQKKFSTDIVSDHVEILDSNRDQGGGGGGGEGNYGGGQSTQGANRGGGAGAGDARKGDAGNGYFPDDDMARPQQGAPRGQGADGGGSAAREPQAGGRAPAKPEPAYPDNDFDDSDPFADE